MLLGPLMIPKKLAESHTFMTLSLLNPRIMHSRNSNDFDSFPLSLPHLASLPSQRYQRPPCQPASSLSLPTATRRHYTASWAHLAPYAIPDCRVSRSPYTHTRRPLSISWRTSCLRPGRCFRRIPRCRNRRDCGGCSQRTWGCRHRRG